MTQEQHMTSYDFYCEFAWERLEDMGLCREEGLPSYAPYINFIEGCAFTCLYFMTDDEQEESFGFTLSEVHKNLSLRFAREFY